MSTLNEKLEEMREASWGSWPKEKRALVERARDALAASGLIERALNPGDAAPDFKLPDADGRDVTLSNLLRSGPVVVVFYRGHW